MSKRSLYQKRSKPMFQKRRSPLKTVMSVILVILLLGAIAFLGYSVGKPIMEFLKSDRPANPAAEQTGEIPKETKAPVTEPSQPEQDETEAEPEPEPEPEPGKRILFVTLPAGGGEDYLKSRVGYAAENGYYGIALELVANGGSIYYGTANELAINSGAVSQSALSDLSAAAAMISEAGLVPYARISALTDHIACWDKSLCYLFENSTSTWLDNNRAHGGKPWISPFSDASKEYVSSLVSEISAAGFAGIISGELEFPPFRNSDLGYIGAKVKSADRYKALQEFSNVLQDALGGAKSYAVEVDAEDVVAGRAEILSAPDSLNAQTVYVKYDSAAVGLRVVKTDETEISYSGLSEADKLTVVMKSVSEALKQSGKTVIPAVTDEALIPQLVSMGFDEQMIVVY